MPERKGAVKMNELFAQSSFLGVVLSLLMYFIGLKLKEKLKWSFLNPLLIGIILVIVFLLLCKVDYASYYASAKYLSWLLTPATVALAIPLYQQIELLKKYKSAVFISVLAGCIASMTTILLLSMLFSLDHSMYVTLLPKSVTTAIGMGISEEMGGDTSVTVAAIIITGILGNIITEGVCKIFRITHPIAIGLAFGTCSHAIGTSRAVQIGEIEGAMSSLSIVVAGILTVIGANLFAMFY